MYHGDDDDIVPIKESVTMLSKINMLGGNAKLEICYGVGHGAWEVAYSGDNLVNWFLSYKKKRD